MPLERVYLSVLNCMRDQIKALIKEELHAGTDPSDILNEGLIPAMDEVGKRYGKGEIFIPEMLQSSLTMKDGMEVLRTLLGISETKGRGTIVIGTVKGDLHDIGKNLVVIMLEGAGYKVIDLGIDVDESAFMAAIEKEKAEILALSALLPTTMVAMEATVAAIKKKGISTKIMVGGAPVTAGFAHKIGADGYGSDAAEAVQIARDLLSSLQD